MINESKITDVTYLFLKLLNIKVTKTYVKNNLEENPFFPSFFSISEICKKLKIETAAVKTEYDKILNISTPFIAQIDGGKRNQSLIVIISTSESQVVYLDGEFKKTKKLSKSEFIKIWSGIVFVADTSNHIDEPSLHINTSLEKRNLVKKVLLNFGIFLIFLLAIGNFLHGVKYQMTMFLLALSKTIGVALTVSLLYIENKGKSSFLKDVCNSSKQMSCDAVLNSNLSKIGGISFSEIGFFYFASTFSFLLFPSIAIQNKIILIGFFSTLVTPFIFFSIYSQWKVIRQWCPLCLSVQFILFCEGILSIFYYWRRDPALSIVSLESIYSPLLICILLPILIWYAIKPIMNSTAEARTFYLQFKRLVNNKDVFHGILASQQEAPSGWQSLGITLGNPAAENTIIKVCNPYCGPCSKAHPILHDIISTNQNVNVKIIFTASTKNSDPRKTIVSHFLALHEYNSVESTESAIGEWYSNSKKDYLSFANKYPLKCDLNLQDSKIDAMRIWCNNALVTHTPTIYINGKKLPTMYSIEELRNIFK